MDLTEWYISFFFSLFFILFLYLMGCFYIMNELVIVFIFVNYKGSSSLEFLYYILAFPVFLHQLIFLIRILCSCRWRCKWGNCILSRCQLHSLCAYSEFWRGNLFLSFYHILYGMDQVVVYVVIIEVNYWLWIVVFEFHFWCSTCSF